MLSRVGLPYRVVMAVIVFVILSLVLFMRAVHVVSLIHLAGGAFWTV